MKQHLSESELTRRLGVWWEVGWIRCSEVSRRSDVITDLLPGGRQVAKTCLGLHEAT